MKKLWMLFAVAAIATACGNSANTAETTEVGSAVEAGDANVLTIAESSVKWTGKKLTGEHYGKIQIAEGQLFVDGDQLSGGSFTIDMNTITVEDLTDAAKNKDLTDHLFSEDFFNVAQYNAAKFEITGVEALATADASGNTHTITGNLTIKGITKGISFPAKVENNANGINASAKFDIDRTLWDIKYRSGKIFPEIGDKVIYDEIGIELNLAANKS
ncbi:MAG: YceI family protein [Sphingobacteriaceae bacterium]|nr:YceI family protein [Sphingobacteriaceae bacterium]